MHAKKYLTLILSICISGICFGQNKLIDSSFGVNGHVEPRFNRERSYSEHLVDKKGRVMIIKDTLLNGTDNATVIYRYNQNGQIDLTFNNSGRLIVNIDQGNINEQEYESFYTHAFLNDYRIVLNIYTDNPDYLDHLVMLNENGSYNNQFGNTGIAALSEEVYVDAIAATPDNKIIVAESIENNRILLYKYLTNGNVDSGFGTAGIKTINLNTIGTSLYIDNLLVNTGGEIFITGESKTENGTLVVVKLNAAGTVMDGYGQNGVVEYFYGESEDEYFYFENPKFNLAGKLMFFAHEEEMRASALVRFNTNGEPDNSFGNNGNGLLLLFAGGFSLNNDNLFFDYEPSSGTGIWLCGISKEQNFYKYVVSKRQDNGTTPEFSFGSGGNATFTINNQDAFAFAIKEVPDGKLLVIGEAMINNYYGISIIKSQANGQIDNAYGSNGMLNIRNDYEYSDDYQELLTTLTHITAGANNSILFTGKYYDAGFNSGSIYVANLAENGSLIDTFGQNGFAAITPLFRTDGNFGKVIRQPDGKIVVAYLVEDVFSFGGGATLLLQRLTATGQPDLSFGTGGRTLFNSNFISPDSDLDFFDVKAAPNGKIGVLISVEPEESTSTTYIQFTQNGLVDNTFSGDGEITPTFLATHLAFSNNNKPILMGYGLTEAQECCEGLLVQRLNQNGTIDNTFNGGTPRQIQSASQDADGVGLIVEADDNITVLFNPDHSNRDFGIAKLTADGLPLPGFGTNGILLGLSGADDFAYGIKLENGGYMFAGNQSDDLVLFKTTVTGTADGSFGTNGLGKINYGPLSDQYGLEGGIVEKAGGKIIVGQNKYNNNNYDDPSAFIAQIKTSSSAATIYTLTNPGNWSNPANWQTGQVPPSTITPGMEIIINPGGNGIATLDINVVVQNGGKIKVAPGKRLNVNALLTVPSIQ